MNVDLVFLASLFSGSDPIEFIWKSIKRVVSRTFISSREIMCNIIDYAYLTQSGSINYAKSWIPKFLPLEVVTGQSCVLEIGVLLG
ncbi:MAG: hypothetical protein M0Z77_00595 [Thermoplasmatales archaeon]|nr:hypothetical protein [Thermoplasmatales archaeon]